MISREDLPTGIVTFLFSDIEGSTNLVQRLGDEAAQLFAEHAGIIRSEVEHGGGVEVSTEGDSFFCVFASPVPAVTCAVSIQRRMADHPWPNSESVRVRIGLHTGTGTLGGDDYFGLDVHRGARIAASGHGGQIVLSESTRVMVERDLQADVTVRDLGLHRLKDLAEPEHLYDLVIDDLPSVFDPLNSGAAAAGDLPRPVTTFIGRTAQVDAIVDLLSGARLVTCTGPGGIGKTRLSLAVAERLSDRFDATLFVPLAPISDPGLVAATILRVIGVPPTAEPAAERLPAYLADKRWLVILDNFEHVIDAAPVVASIIRAAPGVDVLVTSRAALRIAGEHEFAVPPLTLAGRRADDDLEPALQSEAVRLFVERARAVRPDLPLDRESVVAIAEITQALDGLPLAIELAAARVRVMPPTVLLHKMTDMLDVLAGGSREADQRQRTLRGAIQWSYDLLTERQRRLFADLSVFRGGASLDSIEAACGLDRDYWEWLDDLDALVGHSLVRRIDNGSQARFTLLEMIREFAAERLDRAGGAPDVANRHLDWFLDLSERAAAGLTTADQGTWLETLDQERDNLRAALSWAIEQGDTARTSRLALALWRYWHMRGPIPEGAGQVDQILAMEGLSPTDRLRVREAAGGLAWWAGDMRRSAEHYAEALELARAIGTDEQVANALYNAGLATDFVDAGAGTALLREGLALAEETGNVLAKAQCRWGLASAHQHDHDFEGAHEQLSVALADFDAVGDVFMTHWTLRELGSVEMELERLEDARDHIGAALGFFSTAGDLSGTLLTLRDHARLAALNGDMSRAWRLVGAADEHERDSGLNLGQFELESLGLESPLVDGDTESTRRWLEEGRSWTIDEAVRYARSAT